MWAKYKRPSIVNHFPYSIKKKKKSKQTKLKPLIYEWINWFVCNPDYEILLFGLVVDLCLFDLLILKEEC